MATTLSTPLQTLSLQSHCLSQVQPLSLQTLPDDIQQRVLAGVPLDDQQATAAACKAFRAVIRDPRFLALRKRYDGRIIVFLANGHGGGTLVRAADGSWAPYGGVGDSAEAEALTGEGEELMKKGDIESVKGAVAKYEEAARVCDEPAAGWGPRNAFSFASAPAGAPKYFVSASVVLG